jgi:hypothetical protein
MENGVWNNVVIGFDADGLPITLRAEVDGQVSLEGISKLQIESDYLVIRGVLFTNGALPCFRSITVSLPTIWYSAAGGR